MNTNMGRLGMTSSDMKQVLNRRIQCRFETDIQSALSTMPGSSSVILVAMHYTYDPNYTLPGKRNLDNTAVRGLLEFLFFEKKGLLKCSCNSKAKKALYKKLGLPRWPYQLKKLRS
ncbi:hypothetical protein CRENBAI_023835 [Crenichthys baileyi]|uniref:Uncharacterized protein n=1 Tax=Crenichthys baileyi TaxID=28760 RepID=A0AAV9RW86_9TELE